MNITYLFFLEGNSHIRFFLRDVNQTKRRKNVSGRIYKTVFTYDLKELLEMCLNFKLDTKPNSMSDNNFSLGNFTSLILPFFFLYATDSESKTVKTPCINGVENLSLDALKLNENINFSSTKTERA